MFEGPSNYLEIKKEQKEQIRKYNPITTLREREINDDFIYADENGKEIIESNDLHWIMKCIRDGVKEGSVLDLGGGMTHCHRMLPIIDKITHVTSLDISEKNNLVTRELIESSGNVSQFKLVKKYDVDLLKTMAKALSKDETYGIKRSGEEMIRELYEKSQYQGKSDVITADMIEQMDKLGSGELLDNRKYDNVLFLYSFFARNREEALNLIKNAKKCLNKGGKIVVIDVSKYEGFEDAEADNYLMAEDELVIERYPNPWVCKNEEMLEILKEAGFSNLEWEEREASDTEEEKEAFSGYFAIKAEA